MPESPDFDQIAQRILDAVEDQITESIGEGAKPAIVEQLRQIWNARGAAARTAIGRLTFGDYGTDAEKFAYNRAVLDCIAALDA